MESCDSMTPRLHDSMSPRLDDSMAPGLHGSSGVLRAAPHRRSPTIAPPHHRGSRHAAPQKEDLAGEAVPRQPPQPLRPRRKLRGAEQPLAALAPMHADVDEARQRDPRQRRVHARQVGTQLREKILQALLKAQEPPPAKQKKPLQPPVEKISTHKRGRP